MTSAQTSRAKHLVDKQIAMSGQTLDALHDAGLPDDTVVQLDFSFIAPNTKAAEALVAHLQANDCLDLAYERTGGFLSRKCVVSGKTHPTQVNTQVLAEWLPWMVAQGILYDCEFDGWGAEV